MSSFPSNVDIVMSMDTSQGIAKKNTKNLRKDQRGNNGRQSQETMDQNPKPNQKEFKLQEPARPLKPNTLSNNLRQKI